MFNSNIFRIIFENNSFFTTIGKHMNTKKYMSAGASTKHKDKNIY